MQNGGFENVDTLFAEHSTKSSKDGTQKKEKKQHRRRTAPKTSFSDDVNDESFPGIGSTKKETSSMIPVNEGTSWADIATADAGDVESTYVPYKPSDDTYRGEWKETGKQKRKPRRKQEKTADISEFIKTPDLSERRDLPEKGTNGFTCQINQPNPERDARKASLRTNLIWFDESDDDNVLRDHCSVSIRKHQAETPRGKSFVYHRLEYVFNDPESGESSMMFAPESTHVKLYYHHPDGSHHGAIAMIFHPKLVSPEDRMKGLEELTLYLNEVRRLEQLQTPE